MELTITIIVMTALLAALAVAARTLGDDDQFYLDHD